MIDSASLVKSLKTQVLVLEDDLRTRLDEQPDVQAEWQIEHRRLVASQRTASGWTEWRDDRVTQAAVAWVLTTVFVRFAEDNRLLRPVWISGPRERRQEASDAQLAYFRQHPDDTDREWLEQAIEYLRRTPATRDLVEEQSPLWMVSPSGQAASRLLAFWRHRDEAGDLVWDLADPDLSTRFLGDLYENLSQEARDNYALRQTPEFVEEFILDQTLEKALSERPLEGFRLIDPTCGSGHFLLGAFQRLLIRWDREAPAMELQARVQLALDAIHGVDVNPFAVAIARFRLTVAAMQACGLTGLQAAPRFHYHLVAGDSLLFGRPQQTLPIDGADYDAQISQMAGRSEDVDRLNEILEPGRYDVVVGNPPYIAVTDKALKAFYKSRYSSCKGLWVLSVPFMQRFFQLAKQGRDERPAGWVGQITTNSFMKREFGAKLIEQFLVHQDLWLVADTSGAYIPGHGTSTVIITGRNQRPIGETVRAVLRVRGEPGQPVDPAKGLVWRAIVDHINEPGYHDEWISVADLGRGRLATHPWSLSGGGASRLLAAIGPTSDSRLSSRVQRIGLFADSHADEAFFVPTSFARRLPRSTPWFEPAIRGDDVRDWLAPAEESAFFPYSESKALRSEVELGHALRFLWPLRSMLSNRSTFNGSTYSASGRAWFEWHQLPRDASAHQWAITFAFVVTHNHFVLDRGGKVFNRSAPLIKLPEGATEDDHLGLLGVLNSSTACFWLRQVCSPKGGSGIGRGIQPESWMERFEFSSTNVAELPLPTTRLTDRARRLDELAHRLADSSPRRVAEHGLPTVDRFAEANASYDVTRAIMIAEQEELDWEVYGLYGLSGADMVYSGGNLPPLALGERAFEIALARRVAAGGETTAWFVRHGSTPITQIPARWPGAYRDLIQRRLDLIESDPNIRLLEQPEHKRRWVIEGWEKQQEFTLRTWLLNRLEDVRYWFAHGRPTPRSISQLADEVTRNADLVSVIALWEGRPDVPITQSLTRLMTDESVPFLAAYRLKDSGLRKYEAWRETWGLQRREDAGEAVAPIPIPDSYTKADFRKDAWWQARGKLDVPKERFILYPDAGRTTDPTPQLGWAGWDHAQQALALATVIRDREAEGWETDPMIPLVAGLAELQPWVEQWHAEVDPRYGVSLAEFCRQQLAERIRQVDRSPEQLAAWRPQPATRGRKARA